MFRRTRRSKGTVGFALSGGGSRGACQVGALKALTEAGIRPQLLAGTSAGAVNAAWYALHPGELDELESIWLALRTRDVFPGSRFRMLTNIARHGYIHRADPWEAFLRARIGSTRFEDTELPCAVVAIRLRDGKRVVFDSGEIVPAIMASTAIPGVFPPFRVGDELYVDGGVLEFMPVPTLVQRGATTIYALDSSWINPSGAESESTSDRCGRIAAHSSLMQAVADARALGHTVHIFSPELPDVEDARDFRCTSEFIAAGYNHTRASIATLIEEQSGVMRGPAASAG